MNIQLTRELKRLVEANVRSGKYHSASEVIAAALRLMEQTASSSGDLIEETWFAAQREEIVDGDGVFDRIDTELETLATPMPE